MEYASHKQHPEYFYFKGYEHKYDDFKWSFDRDDVHIRLVTQIYA